MPFSAGTKVVVAVTSETSTTLVMVIFVAVVLPDLILTVIDELAASSLLKLPFVVTSLPSTVIVPLFCSIA